MERFLKKSHSSLLEFYRRHETVGVIVFFLIGFLFDIYRLGRIDDFKILIKQASFLIVLGGFLFVQLKIEFESFQLPEKIQRFWQYHELFVHFLFGSLLSMYTIFYYSSASAISSFIFIALILGLAFANELSKFRKMGIIFRITLFNICLLSFFSFLYPILFGHIGSTLFWLGFASSLLVMAIFLKFILHVKNEHLIQFKNKILFPTLIIHALFLIGYFTSLIPPVPLAVKKIGVYYKIIKDSGDYRGEYLDQFPFIWHKGSQHFYARNGDKIYVMLSIFSPTYFNDKIYLNWHCRADNGHESIDSIPLEIFGGRDQGFRGYGTKENFLPGTCLVTVETSDKREVGRINIKIFQDQELKSREFITDHF